VEQARIQAEKEAKQRAEEEAARIQAEEEARVKAEEEDRFVFARGLCAVLCCAWCSV